MYVIRELLHRVCALSSPPLEELQHRCAQFHSTVALISVPCRAMSLWWIYKS